MFPVSRLLGVTITVDVSLTNMSQTSVRSVSFDFLCHSLDVESVKTLVHAFVASRVDYCNSVLALQNLKTH